MRCFHPERHQIIHTEVDNLLRAGFIREVKHHEWVANMVVVAKKKRGGGGGGGGGCKWQVCVDYTDLNEACPKVSFLLPRIDQIVDATVWHRILSFLEAFSRYHQIPMHPPNVEKTTFITPHELYYYDVMPFVLKNVGATYQRLVTKIS